MKRHCDAYECGTFVSPGRFLCSTHWRLVPVETQRTINTRYRQCKADFAFLSDLAYLQACVDAIDGIARRERGAGHEAGQGSYHRLLRIAQKKAQA
jgi:hypothetical protein